MADCACSGIRSCLLCESAKDVKNSLEFDSNHETKLKTLIFCVQCQKLYSETVFQEDFLQNSVQSCSKQDCFEDIVSGITVIEDFITKNEEEFMLAEIEKFPWQVSQSGRQKQVGHLSIPHSPCTRV
jgi:hypothetical protein